MGSIAGCAYADVFMRLCTRSDCNADIPSCPCAKFTEAADTDCSILFIEDFVKATISFASKCKHISTKQATWSLCCASVMHSAVRSYCVHP